METKSAAQIVKENYYDYGKYINLEGRVICDEKDGLKKVQRLILYSAYRIYRRSPKPVKEATLVGDTMGKYHPHGDAGIAGAVAGLVRDGMLVGIGNFGSNVGLDIIEPAAMRYPECMIERRIINLAFKYIDDVSYYNNDLSFTEPEYLPTPLPLNLCHFSDTEDFVSAIGFGIAYTLPKFDVNDLFNLLKDIVEGKPIVNNVHVCYRSLRVKCPDELFNTGQGTIVTKARYVIANDRKKFYIYEFPATNRTPRNMLKVFDGVLVDLSKDTTNVEVNLPKDKTVDDFDLDKLMTGKINVDMYFHDGKVIKRYSLPEILKVTYNYYACAVLNNINKCISKLTNHIKLVELLIKMKPYLNPLNNKTRDRVKKALKLDDKTTDELMKYNIKQICEAEKHLDEVKKELDVWVHRKNNLDEFCLSEIEESLK